MARKIRAREILRLLEAGMSRSAIARSQGVSKHSIQAVEKAADDAGVGWAQAQAMSDAEVHAGLFPDKVRDRDACPDPDRERVRRELARTGVTLKGLHAGHRDETRSEGEPLMPCGRLGRRCRELAVGKQAASRVGRRAEGSRRSAGRGRRCRPSTPPRARCPKPVCSWPACPSAARPASSRRRA